MSGKFGSYGSGIEKRIGSKTSSYGKGRSTPSYISNDYGIGRKGIGEVHKGYSKRSHRAYGPWTYRPTWVSYEANQNGGSFKTEAPKPWFSIEDPK